MFTDDKNAQVVLSLLKQYGIKNIVISPGTTNVPISRSVQIDSWFTVYSVVDERSAAYFATGLSYKLKEPVVISCTGATASRNYLSGLTEAYYRNLPIIALTSQHHTSDFGNLMPQVTDRTVSQNDIKKLSVQLPVVKDEEDYERCVLSMNKALIAATTNGGGPVHINLQVVGDYAFNTKLIPRARKIDYVDTENLESFIPRLKEQLIEKKVGIFIGAHERFDKVLTEAISEFSDKYGAPVFIDQTSGYKGKNAALISQVADLKQSRNKPDLLIDLGSITGEYTSSWLNGIETWRLSEDGQIHDRFHKQTLLFDGPEEVFFSAFAKLKVEKKSNYASDICKEVEKIIFPADAVPLSNTYISHRLSQVLPKGSSLHMGILNSLRNMNFFKLDASIDTSSNVGGFGIDGALSTLIGQSMVDESRLTFGLVGDLAAFYDMNALGIRHIKNNIRILLVNNNGGVEFRLNQKLETQWADETDEFISAAGHHGSIDGWAKSMNFHYMSADSKETFEAQIKQFCSPDLQEFGQPVVFEVFTKIPDEQAGVYALQLANKPHRDEGGSLVDDGQENVQAVESQVKQTIKKHLKRVTPKKVRSIYRKYGERG